MKEDILKVINEYYDMITLGLISYIPKIFGAILILWIGFKFVNIIETWIEKILTRQRINPMLRTFTLSLSNMALKLAIIILAAGVLGVQTSSLVAMLAAAGFAVGMALSGTLQNFAGGVMILLLKPFKIGHYIETGNHKGIVKEIGIFNTTLSTNDNKKIFIPNSDISNGVTVNYSASKKRRVDLVVGISYQDDIDKAKKVLEKISKSDERILEGENVTIGVSELGDNSVNLVFRFFVKSLDYWPVHFDILEKVKKEFDKNGLNFPFPQRDVHLYNEK